MKANYFEPALRPNHQRSMADPAVILCLNRVSFTCLYLVMCHEVSHHILEYPFKQKPIANTHQLNYTFFWMEKEYKGMIVVSKRSHRHDSWSPYCGKRLFSQLWKCIILACFTLTVFHGECPQVFGVSFWNPALSKNCFSFHKQG